MTRFVDTNILVYAHDPGDPEKQSVARKALLEHAEQLVLSTQILSELYTVLTRPVGLSMLPTDARAIVEELSAYPVIPLDAGLVLDAIDISLEAKVSYWDGLVVAAARSAGCELVMTEDLSHGATIAGVRIESPFATT